MPFGEVRNDSGTTGFRQDARSSVPRGAKPAVATVAEIETAFAERLPTRRRWQIVLLVSVFTMALVGLFLGRALQYPWPRRRPTSPMIDWFNASDAGWYVLAALCLFATLVLLAIRGLRSRVRVGNESHFSSVGDCRLEGAPSSVHVLQDGWRFSESSVPWIPMSLAGGLPGVAMLIWVVGDNGGLIFAAAALQVALGMTLNPRGLQFSAMRRVTRRGKRVFVSHDAEDIPLPFVLDTTNLQWDRLRASLPPSIEVEELAPSAATTVPTFRRAYVPPPPPPRTAIDARKLKELDATLDALSNELAADERKRV